jgi:hypothetical protein
VRALAAVFSLLVLASCFSDGECLITNTNLVKVSFRAKKDNSIASVAFKSISVLNDVVLYKNTSESVVRLPVNPGLNETSFVFVYGDKTDTLSLGYDNLTAVLAPHCGAFPYQRNLKVLNSTFGQDSVVVTNPSLLRDVPENVRIYF